MSKENVSFWAEGSHEEIGDLISLVRNDYLKLTPMQLGDAIGAKPDTIEKSEQGKNAHGFAILKKTCEKYNLKFDISISTK